MKFILLGINVPLLIPSGILIIAFIRLILDLSDRVKKSEK